ncbi:MAG: PQQ-binding-like beta-propeller repeat protein [Planctomycetaceae bacterium]
MPDSATGDSARQPSNAVRRAGSAFIALLIAAMLGGVVYVWSIDPVWGRGIQIVVTYGVVVLSLLLGLLWLALFSTYRWRTILAVFAALVLVAGAGASTVRNVEFSGDMQVILHYRWAPTHDDLLRQHRRSHDLPAPARTGEPSPGPATEEDAPAYRGSQRDGVIVGPPLRQNWISDPPKELWRQPCGGGYASFAVLDDRLVTLEQRGESEAIVCYEAASGRQQWVYEYPALFSEVMGGAGPRATPTIDNGTVFSFGALGDLVALDLVTGSPRWARDLLPDGLPVVQWGLCSSPLVIGDQVIVEVGGPEGDGLVSVHRETGDLLWQRPGVARLSEPGAKNRAGYGSPVLAKIDGVDQVLIFDGEGLRSHVPETGEPLWFAPFRNDPGVNVAQPIVFDDGRILLAMSYGVGCKMIRVSREGGQWREPETLWNNLHMKCKFTSPVLHDGFVYGLDEGILVCLDPQTGDRRWKGGSYGMRGRFYHGQILLTNGQILGFTERGDLVLVEATPEEYRELAAFKAIDTRKVWNQHILSRGRVFVRSHEEMAAFDLCAGN